MALGADALGCAKPQAKRVFSRSRRLLASYSGESPVQRAAILLPLHARRRRRWRQQFAGAEYGSRGLEGPLNLHSEPNPNDVAVGALSVGAVSVALSDNPIFAGGTVAVAGEVLFLAVLGILAARGAGDGAPEAEPAAPVEAARPAE